MMSFGPLLTLADFQVLTPLKVHALNNFPNTGGNLGVWGAIGAILIAIGLAVYGYTHRRQARVS